MEEVPRIGNDGDGLFLHNDSIARPVAYFAD
jgi:hypothetical protein